MFYDVYLDLCKKHNKKPYTVARELEFVNSRVAVWKGGSTPRSEDLQKIADYFNVDVRYLLTGEEQIKPVQNVGKMIDNQKQKKPDSVVGVELSDTQKEAMEFIMSLSDEQLKRFIKGGKAMYGEE